MRIIGRTLSIIAGVFSMVLWIVFVLYNPYTNSTASDAAFNTFIMIFLPACLAIYASCRNKKVLMLAAFIWSLPISLYLTLTTGIFAWFIASCIAYFVCYLLMLLSKIKTE